MAGALWKKEVVIRQTSTISITGAKDWTKNWLSSFQNKPENIDASGGYIDYFFADLFDARTGNLYRIFSDAAGAKYSMSEVVFDILIPSRFVPWTSVSNHADMNVDPNMIATRGAIRSSITQRLSTFLISLSEIFIPKTMISNDTNLANDEDFIIARSGLADVLDDFVATSSVINDVGTISGNTMTLAHIPAGGIIGGKCSIRIGASNTYDEVECVATGTTLTIHPDTSGEYDGEVCLVSYLINR